MILNDRCTFIFICDTFPYMALIPSDTYQTQTLNHSCILTSVVIECKF